MARPHGSSLTEKPRLLGRRRARNALALGVCVLGAWCFLAAERPIWASREARPQGTKPAWSTLSNLAQRVAKETHARLTGKGRQVEVKSTQGVLKFFEEGPLDNRILARLLDCKNCVVVEQHPELQIHLKRDDGANATKWTIEKELSEVYVVTQVGDKFGDKYRRLVLKANPSQQSPRFEQLVEDKDSYVVVQIGEAQVMLSKADPTESSVSFDKIVGDFGPSLVVQDGTVQRVILKAHPDNSSLWFHHVVERRDSHLIVEEGGKPFSISLENPSQGLPVGLR